jgi:hypothetical protein
VKAARAVYRGYVSNGRRAGQVRRLHVVRDEGPAGWESGKQTMCGQHAWDVTRSESVVIPLPCRPPDGLTWCPKCIGLLAERYGLLDEVAASVTAYDPELADLAGERFWEFAECQREVRRKRMAAAGQ